MTVPTLAGTWVADATALFLDAVDGLPDSALDEPCALPGWTRRHLIAHVAGNAEALGRLVSWARTGVENPMYASPQQRAADIAAGAAKPAAELRAWLRGSAAELADGFASLPERAWSAQVVTAQGRRVPATELPWLRAREVAVHAVDLGTGLTFAVLPAGFCRALVDDVARWRGARGDGPALELATAGHTWTMPGLGGPHRIELPIDELAAWLTGRADRPDLPELPRWL
jgi:maleylpyruvate isomerase